VVGETLGLEIEHVRKVQIRSIRRVVTLGMYHSNTSLPIYLIQACGITCYRCWGILGRLGLGGGNAKAWFSIKPK
jgi:hypothetical protein